MRVASAVSAAIAAHALALFIEPPKTGYERAQLLQSLPIAGWVVDEAPIAASQWTTNDDGTAVPVVRLMPTHGSSSIEVHASQDRSRMLDSDAPRRLLRVSAPESATPGLNWALGLDALRVLETASEDRGRLDWLLSVEAAEIDDIRESIACGVHGSIFQRREALALRGAEATDTVGAAAPACPALDIQLLPEAPTALVLPEACRGAAVAGALPPNAEALWRVTPTTRAGSVLERCVAIAPFWVSTNNVDDAMALACSLPRGAAWVAHLCGGCATPLSARDTRRLRAAGCGGLAVGSPSCLTDSLLQSVHWPDG